MGELPISRVSILTVMEHLGIYSFDKSLRPERSNVPSGFESTDSHSGETAPISNLLGGKGYRYSLADGRH
jgi:hypothetical protein